MLVVTATIITLLHVSPCRLKKIQEKKKIQKAKAEKEKKKREELAGPATSSGNGDIFCCDSK